MKVTKLGRHIGALIEDVDLKTLSATDAEGIRTAIYEHQIVFFRNQDLSDEQQIEFTKQLGTILPTYNKLVNILENSAEKPPGVDEWHTDAAQTSVPPLLGVLQARIIPEYGGDTLWVSLQGIWNSLSPKMQEMLRGLRVRHGVKLHRLAAFKRSLPGLSDEEILRDCQAFHPLVRTHPITGKEGLFLSGITQIDIEGMNPTESRLLLGYFEQLMDDPNFNVRWHWQPYDVAVWDETSTNHRALSDHFPQYRLMRRTTVGGAGEPFYRPAKDEKVGAESLSRVPA